MPICADGHTSHSSDYCDTCGSPITNAENPAPASPEKPKPAGLACPNCDAVNLPDSLFCEACGYDFTTGSMPRVADTSSWLDLGPEPEPEPEPAPQPAPEPEPAPEPQPQPEPAPTPEPAPAAPGRPLDGPVQWVAELWIDPQWYEVQESPDPLPSPGLPDIIPLRSTTVLIGRTSHSRGIFPDIEGGADTGISRRQAQLTTDQKRWFVEDLDSANGTFVGPAAGPLPDEPLTPGRRHELEASDRIYVGAWTRIVLRHATAEEAAADSGRTA